MTLPLPVFILLFVFPYLVSGTLTLLFAIQGWRYRHIRISIPFTLIMAALTVWFYGYVLELVSPNLTMSLLFNHIEVPCTLVVPVAFLVLVLYYTGHENYVTKKNLLLLSVIPVIVMLLELSNDYHFLYYTQFYPISFEGMTVWMHDYGPFFLIGVIYTYTLVTVALILILAALIGTGKHQRRPLALLLIASIVPVIMNLLFILKVISPGGLDLTPVAFLVTGLILAFGLFRYLLFSMPVAYKKVISQMQEGVILTNGPSLVIDLNPAAEQITGVRAEDAVGKEIASVFPPLSSCMGTGIMAKDGTRTECMYPREGHEPVYLDIITMPLGEPVTGSGAGFILLRDITERKKTELALAEANRKINLLSGITRHDIRNQLTALSAYLMLCEETPDDPVAQKGYFTMLNTIAARIEHQIGFTKLYEDLGVNAPAWQDAESCIRQAMDGLTPGNVRVDIAINGISLYADPLLEKVFYNLLDNALRYGGPDLTTIHVTTHPADAGLDLVFEDNGAGVDQNNKLRIFDKGFGKNTGFGLFLSREILSLTGITITEDGIQGRG
ncbi:MAG: PAS domain S-box protein, partial [Methanomicrobiales archaeon]|nr:PAS domain S-box protein [Methanomicrobiales archaeon]